MAVVVQCYQCSAILELDEGFRGGVCRCSQCGALLQVPKAGEGADRRVRPAAPGAAVATGAGRPGSPLEDPGLSRGAFAPEAGAPVDRGAEADVRSPQRPEAPGVRARRSSTLMIVSMGLGVVVLAALVVVVVLYVMSAANEESQPPPQVIATPDTPTQTAEAGAGFVGVPLVGRQMVFSIDSGSAAQDTFSHTLAALELALAGLEADQQFKVALWKGEGVETIPAEGWYGKSDLPALHEALLSTAALGATSPSEAMRKSLELGGDQTIVVTAKYGLDETLADEVLAARKAGQRVDAVRIGPRIGTPESDNPLYPLRKIAAETGGKFERVDLAGLEAFIRKAEGK